MNKKFFKFIISFILIFAIFCCVISASAFQISGFELNAKGAMLISLDTDEVLYAKNADSKMYPASITKLLVAAVMLDNTQNLDTEIITYTNEANNAILGTGASVIGLKIGEELTARQALHCLLISSGGDVAYAIAHHYGGTTEHFMAMMNNKAAEIGMVNSSFGNPVGLHDDATYSTPRDVSILAKYVLKYDIILEITSLARYQLPATNMSGVRYLSTTNFLIDPATNYFYKYAKGLKTGFTDEAGRCVVSTASLDGYNYLCIIMNCNSKGGVRNEFIDSRNLYRWAFNNFEYKSVLDITKPVAEIPVDLSLDTDYIPLYPENSIRSILPIKADESTITIDTTLTSERVKAPVKAGTVLGTADVLYAGEVIGKVNLISREDVKPNLFLQIGATVKNVVASTAFKIIIGVLVFGILVFIGICIHLNTNNKKRRKVKYIPYDKDRRR